MSKNKNGSKSFVIIMQVIVQVLLLFPWIYWSTGKVNAILCVVNIFSSGDAFHAVKEGLSGSVDFSYMDEQAVGQMVILFLFEVLAALLVQLISLINLLITIFRKHVKFLDAVCLVCGLFMQFSMANGFLFSSMISNIYPFILLLVLGIEFLGVRMAAAWKEANKEYYEAKERDRELKRERKRRLVFPGKYTHLFQRVMWENFRSNQKDYIILLASVTLSSSLIFAGIGMAEMLSPLNKEGDLFRGHGIDAILLNFLIVSLIISVFLVVSVLLAYFGKRSRSYGIFVNLGLRRKTLYSLLGIEIISAIIFASLGGILAGNLLLICARGLLRRLSDIGNQMGSVSFASYFAVMLVVLVIFGMSFGIIRECILGSEIEKTKVRAVEEEKLPGRLRVPFFLLGIVFILISFMQFRRRENAEGIQLLLLLFIGLFLAMKNGWCMFLLYRKRHKNGKYYSSLIQYNTFYYRYKTTVRYLFFVGIVPIAMLFQFAKEMISAQIAQEPERLFPYDFMLMATEEDDAFFEELKEQYDVNIRSYPMVRVTNVDNTETQENYNSVIMPQGQHIGVSESTYYELSEAVGSSAQRLHLSEDGSDVFIVYQQDKSVKAHPIDYFLTRKEPYLHIGQPVESYSFIMRETVFPKRNVYGEKIDILTGAYRRGDYENVVVFSDRYFSEVQDSWKTVQWQTGEPVGDVEAIEGVNIHHWPTKLKLMNVDEDVYDKVEKQLLTFKKSHAFDEIFDGEVLSYYSSKAQIAQMKGERLMTVIVNAFIICALQLISLFIIYLKFESEVEEKRKRRDFLRCIGMRYKERMRVLKTEVQVYLWVPLLTAVVTVPLLTGCIWILREYTKEDCLRYSKIWLVIVSIYILMQTLGVKLIETYVIGKVEGWEKPL